MKNKITLILPYFGVSFPNTFDILLDSMINNEDVEFLIPTNIDFSEYPNVNNVHFVKMTLSDLKKELEGIVGFNISLEYAYKLCDFRPVYGKLFHEFLVDCDWWGYFDADIIFGNISNFITDDILNSYERLFSNGHLTLFKNNEFCNNLYNYDFNLPGLPTFKEVSTNSTLYAFDEFGWGRNNGRGLSYAIEKTRILKQYNNKKIIIDLNKNRFEFQSTLDVNFSQIIYYKGKVLGKQLDNQTNEFLYVHFQKRNVLNEVTDLNKKIYFVPNIFTNDISNYNAHEELTRWKKDQKRRTIKTKLSKLNYSYFKRRLRFFNTE